MNADTTNRRPGARSRYRHHGRAMGTTLDLEIVGDRQLLEVARSRVDELEQRWSRFIAGSDISRCNSTRGLPVMVHADTRLLVRQAIQAFELTGGALDPTVLDALLAAGYDRPFAALRDDDVVHDERNGTPSPGCTGIDVDDEMGTITLPRGTGFDPGAIGKGLAADIVATELVAAGATGAFVSIGGDIRTAGSPPEGDGWSVAVRAPADDDQVIATIAIPAAGLATSTDARRRWRRGGTEAHHIIDPRTGRPADGDAAQVTTVAGEAWWAEALATRLMLTPRDGWSPVTGDDAALIVDRTGRVHAMGPMREYLT